MGRFQRRTAREPKPGRSRFRQAHSGSTKEALACVWGRAQECAPNKTLRVLGHGSLRRRRPGGNSPPGDWEPGAVGSRETGAPFQCCRHAGPPWLCRAAVALSDAAQPSERQVPHLPSRWGAAQRPISLRRRPSGSRTGSRARQR